MDNRHDDLENSGIRVGDVVRIKRGICGDGYIFTVSSIHASERGWLVYGNGDTYGPVGVNDVSVTRGYHIYRTEGR
jgi:hypothetical protein